MSNHAFQNERKLNVFARTLGEIMDIPPIVVHYKKLMDEYRTAIVTFDKQLAKFKVEEKIALNTEDDWRLVMNRNEFDYESNLFDKARQIIEQIVSSAEKTFAGEADSLKIDSSKYLHMFLNDDDGNRDTRKNKVMQLDIFDVWGQLVSDYGEGKGELEAYAQHANKIIQAFDLRVGDEIKVVGGNIVLEKSMYLDRFDKKYGSNRYSYGCRNEMIELLGALNKFFKWAGKSEYIHPTNVISHRLNESRRTVESREKFMISDEVYFITMSNKLDFRFSQPLGFLLQQFVTEFGELRLARAA